MCSLLHHALTLAPPPTVRWEGKIRLSSVQRWANYFQSNLRALQCSVYKHQAVLVPGITCTCSLWHSQHGKVWTGKPRSILGLFFFFLLKTCVYVCMCSGHVSADKSPGYSSRGPKFNSQHHTTAHNHRGSILSSGFGRCQAVNDAQVSTGRIPTHIKTSLINSTF